MKKLTQPEIDRRLAKLPEWSQSGDMLQHTLSFADFRSAMAFVNRIADLAEQKQHHPDIMVRYNKVTLTVSTHDAGGITLKDFEFARAADEAVGDYARPAAN
jgi:4a-hydroxytetrahydrobiopterin dehydratase